MNRLASTNTLWRATVAVALLILIGSGSLAQPPGAERNIATPEPQIVNPATLNDANENNDLPQDRGKSLPRAEDNCVGDSLGIGSKEVRVAGIVLKWLRTDKAANFRRIEPMIRRAAKGGAKIVCTTECFLDGYAIADKSIPLDQYRALGEPIPAGEYFQKLAQLAKELKIYLIAGMLEADGNDRFNTAVVLGPDGKLIGKYHKQMLEHELVRNTPGHDSKTFDTEFGRVGVIICADRRFPEIVAGICSAGADFLICPSGGMFGSKKNDPIVQDRSCQTGRYIVFVHPAEFLVTDPSGAIVSRTILGDRLLITPEQSGQTEDQNQVFYFDLPTASVSRTSRANQ